MATANKHTTDDYNALESLVKCAMCLDYYKDPRVLPCSHTFCYGCLKNLCQGGIAYCPMRDKTIINSSIIDRLPVNRIAKDLVEHIQQSEYKSSTMAVAKCENCQQMSSDYVCETCSKSYCTLCLKEEHSLEEFETHKIQVLINDQLNIQCSEHEDEKLKYWCIDCEKLVCSDCLVYEHKQHTFVTLNDMAQEAKTKFNSSMQRLLSMKEKLEAVLEMTQMGYQKHQQACVQSKTDIEKIMSNFQNLIEKQKKQLITKIDSNNAHYEPIIKQQQEDIDEQLKTVLIRILLTKQMCDTSNLHQIIKMKGDLITYNELIEEQYEQLMEGCMFDIMHFVPDENLSQIKQSLEKLDNISVESFLTDGSHIQPLLKISDACDNYDYIALDGTHAYGYHFYLTVPLKFQAVRVKSKLVDNDLSIYILNSNSILIQTETIHVNNRNTETFKWFAIPITCEIENNYSILVWAKSNEQETPLLIVSDFEDQNLRRINQNVSVRNVHALIDTSQSIEIGMEFNVVYETLSNNDSDLVETVPCINMILDI